MRPSSRGGYTYASWMPPKGGVAVEIKGKSLLMLVSVSTKGKEEAKRERERERVRKRKKKKKKGNPSFWASEVLIEPAPERAGNIRGMRCSIEKRPGFQTDSMGIS